MRRDRLAFALVAVLSACHERPALLAPDLVVDFGCPTNPSTKAVTTFLSAQGFTSLDLEAVRRKEGNIFFPLQIDAFNRRRIMIEVIGLQKQKSYGSGVDYRLTITSPPPTKHDLTLEENAVRFASRALHCKLHAVNHFENGPDAVRLFNTVFEDMQRRMRAAARSA